MRNHTPAYAHEHGHEQFFADTHAHAHAQTHMHPQNLAHLLLTFLFRVKKIYFGTSARNAPA